MNDKKSSRDILARDWNRAKLLSKLNTRKLWVYLVVLVGISLGVACVVFAIEVTNRTRDAPEILMEEFRSFGFVYVGFFCVHFLVIASFIMGYIWLVFRVGDLFSDLVDEQVVPFIAKRYFRSLSPESALWGKKLKWEIEHVEAIRKMTCFRLFLGLLGFAIFLIFLLFVFDVPVLSNGRYNLLIWTAASILLISFLSALLPIRLKLTQKLGLDKDEVKELIMSSGIEGLALGVYAILVLYGLYLPWISTVLIWRRVIVPRLANATQSLIKSAAEKGVEIPKAIVAEFVEQLFTVHRVSDMLEMFPLVLPLVFVLLLLAFLFMCGLPLLVLSGIRASIKKTLLTIILIFSASFFQWSLFQVFYLPTNLWSFLSTMLAAGILSMVVGRVLDFNSKK